MKKIFCIAIATLLLSAPAPAQQDSTSTEKKPKKESGFMKFLKKGVESTTGLNVSKETLFVYPTLGEWKMSLVSAVGDSQTGNVKVTINASWLMNSQSSAFFQMKEVVRAGGVVLKPDVDWEHGSDSHAFTTGVPTEVTFRRITVPKDTPSLDAIKFTVGNQEGFEARDIPITWQ